MIVFEQWIAGRMADHARAEAARNAPAAVACAALDTLREALAVMTLSDRCEVLTELHGLAVELDAAAWAGFGAAYATREG